LILYRAVSEAELADWHESGTLRSKEGGMEGKHLTDTVVHALGFAWGVFLERGWERGRMFVLEVTFEGDHGVEPYEQNQDGVGPAYFADDAALQFISKVKLVCRVEDER